MIKYVCLTRHQQFIEWTTFSEIFSRPFRTPIIFILLLKFSPGKLHAALSGLSVLRLT